MDGEPPDRELLARMAAGPVGAAREGLRLLYERHAADVLAFLNTIADATTAARPAELAPEGRAHSAAHLRMLGGLSVAVGLLGFFVGTFGLLNRIAATGGPANPLEVLGGLGALLYDPLAAGLEEADSGLGDALEAPAAVRK